MPRKSVMGHQFSQVPRADIPRSSFDRSHGYKTTFDGGYLIPVFVDEAMPGDTFNLKMTALARMATPIFPIMDNLFLDSFFFAVPHRLVWENWERFCGAQDDPGDSTDFLIPTVDTVGGYPEAGLFDYFGLPIDVGGLSANALPARAYNLIWNEWFRDQNLQDSITVPVDDGPDSVGDYPLKRRGKRHDYFTSCLPWPQKGDSVDLPLGLSAPVAADPGTANTQVTVYSVGQAADVTMDIDASHLLYDAPGSGAALYADLSDATAATINELRQAFQIQKLLERDARGGSRYIEIVKSHFGVTSPDLRATRPEYLGGGSTRVNISPIAQTSRTDTGETPLATLAAIGTAHVSQHGFTKSFTEHCVVIGLISVRADLTYQQGMNRMWSRQTRYDYYWPALAHIGEQAVLNKEIYAQGTSVDDDVFGYQERYAEYRYKPSLITGAFRSTAATPLDAWHLSQEFSSLPVLGNSFIVDNPPIDRVVAVTTEPEFLFDAYFDLRCARPMPLFGVPGLIDHF